MAAVTISCSTPSIKFSFLTCPTYEQQSSETHDKLSLPWFFLTQPAQPRFMLHGHGKNCKGLFFKNARNSNDRNSIQFNSIQCNSIQFKVYLSSQYKFI